MEVLYVTSDVTLEDVALQFNVAAGIVRQHSADEHWTDKREDFRDSIVKFGMDTATHLAVMDKTRFDSMASAACDLGVSKILLAMRDSSLASLLRNSDISILTSSLKTLVESKYRILNIPVPSHITVDDDRANPPADSVEDEIKLAVDDAMKNVYAPLALPEVQPDNGNGNGNGSDNGTD